VRALAVILLWVVAFTVARLLTPHPQEIEECEQDETDILRVS